MNKVCKCGTHFWTFNPKHGECRRCYRKGQRDERARREKVGETETLRRAMVESYLKNDLPKSARASRNGSQVIVVWMGRSYTFHISGGEPKAQPTRKANPVASQTEAPAAN